MSGMPANRTWFNFSIQNENFAVYSFSGIEEVCKPYEFVIELVTSNSSVDINSLLGMAGSLSVQDKSGETRFVHGLIAEFEQLHTANYFTHYRCKLVPRLWFLDQINDHRIFQNMSVVEIINQILQEQGFPSETVSFKIFYDYAPREYCVQYDETDLHFITRLCEEEGLYFYFEHSLDNHCLCFSDREGGPRIVGESSLRFYAGSGQLAESAVISRLNLHHKVNSNVASYREWNFQKTKLNLEVSKKQINPDKAPVPNGMLLENYQYPHLYELQATGTRYADLQLTRQLTFMRWIELESDVSRYLPAYTFMINNHQRNDVNAEWWVVSVRHEGEQPGVLEHEAPDGRGLSYKSFVVAIPDTTRFVAELHHPKNRIEALQSAIVTGPDGEEVFTDEYGRVKVHFHWDRRGHADDRSSCWVRVADTWAGEGFGFIQIPRVGQEVIVEYMEGDPDRPVITGRVYNAAKLPPWSLPGQKTLSGIQSREFSSGRRNQLVLDDSQGEIQAQLSSDHQLSQLNLGYLTRVNHGEGRKDFRGEGFELRTDGWGVVRAGKGLILSTARKEKAQGHHKDIAEPTTLLKDASAVHDEATKQSVMHKTTDNQDHEAISKALEKQNKSFRGMSEKFGELSEPHMLLHSPAGIAISTPESMHTETGEHLALTSHGHSSIVTGKNLLATAFGAIRIFAHNLGIRIFSGKGKVEIQAQDNDIDIIAQKVLRLISVQDKIEITAAKEILLCADGSYIKISRYGIEHGTPGRFVVRAASHSMEGPDSKSGALPDLPEGSSKFNDEYVIRNFITDEPIGEMHYELNFSSGETISGITGSDGKIPLQKSLNPEGLAIKLLGIKK